MTRLALILIGGAAIGLLAACADQTSAPGLAAQSSSRQCFLASDVNGFSFVSDSAVDIQVGANRYYRLSLNGWCPQSAFSQRLALKTTGGSSWICQGLDAEIIVPSPGGAQRCLVNSIQPLTKEAWLADRKH
jgi:hypothetical protein